MGEKCQELGLFCRPEKSLFDSYLVGIAVDGFFFEIALLFGVVTCRPSCVVGHRFKQLFNASLLVLHKSILCQIDAVTIVVDTGKKSQPKSINPGTTLTPFGITMGRCLEKPNRFEQLEKKWCKWSLVFSLSEQRLLGFWGCRRHRDQIWSGIRNITYGVCTSRHLNLITRNHIDSSHTQAS